MTILGITGYLRQIREAVDVPLLRKDFVIDARRLPGPLNGARTRSLIVAIPWRSPASFTEWPWALGYRRWWVHDAEELTRAKALEAR